MAQCLKPATLIGWHRTAFRCFWRWKSRPVGRPPISAEVRELIRRMAAENPTWGEDRIADELRLKLQIRLSPRTVGKYIRQLLHARGSKDQRWSTFLRNHAQAACITSIDGRMRHESTTRFLRRTGLRIECCSVTRLMICVLPPLREC
jgi:hypothetical protein